MEETDHVLAHVGGGRLAAVLPRSPSVLRRHERALAVEVDDMTVAAGDVIAVVAFAAARRVAPSRRLVGHAV